MPEEYIWRCCHLNTWLHGNEYTNKDMGKQSRCSTHKYFHTVKQQHRKYFK